MLACLGGEGINGGGGGGDERTGEGRSGGTSCVGQGEIPVYSLSSRPLTGELDGETPVWGRAWGRSAAPHTPTSRKVVTLFSPPPDIFSTTAAPSFPVFSFLSLPHSLSLFHRLSSVYFNREFHDWSIIRICSLSFVLSFLSLIVFAFFRSSVLATKGRVGERRLYSRGIWVRLSVRISNCLSI